MKTQEYIAKYRLNADREHHFNYQQFVADLTQDFEALLETGNARSNIKGYENAVRAIRMKWDAINNKTVGELPSGLWNYFYATVVARRKKELFPQEMERRRRAAEERERIRQEEQRLDQEMYGWFFGFGFFDGFFKELFEQIRAQLRDQTVETSFSELGLDISVATVDDVRRAYRTLCMKLHPDTGGDQESFIKLTEAKNRCLNYLMEKSTVN